MQKNTPPPCAVCKLIRIYMMVAVPMIFVMWTKPELTRLQGISLTNAFATLVTCAFVGMVSWKYYQEIWKPRREAADKERT